MRLHRLTMTAVGPYPGTEVIDFDRFAASGRFLLTGPTGAGKTTIIDAIVFALYGDVAGTRTPPRTVSAPVWPVPAPRPSSSWSSPPPPAPTVCAAPRPTRGSSCAAAEPPRKRPRSRSGGLLTLPAGRARTLLCARMRPERSCYAPSG